MKASTIILTLLIAVSFIVAPGASPAKEKAIEIKFAHPYPSVHILGRACDEAFSPLEKMSGGRLKVRFFPAGGLVGAKETFDSVVGGVADIGLTGHFYTPGRFPMATITSLPGLFPNSLIGTEAFNTFIETTPYIKEEYKDVQHLASGVTSPYTLVTKEKVSSVEDLKGLRLRVSGGHQSKTLMLLGASAVQMSPGDIQMSLERGLLDGMPYPLASVPAYRFYEVAEYVLDNVTWEATPIMWVMNKKSWEKLTPDLQAMIKECAIYASKLVGAYYGNDTQLATEFLKNKGMKFYQWPDSEVKKFYTTLQPLRDNWVTEMEAKGLPGQKALDDMLKITKKLTGKWDK